MRPVQATSLGSLFLIDLLLLANAGDGAAEGRPRVVQMDTGIALTPLQHPRNAFYFSFLSWDPQGERDRKCSARAIRPESMPGRDHFYKPTSVLI
jgi:hypothetical protein